jgi:hypothetical protein
MVKAALFQKIFQGKPPFRTTGALPVVDIALSPMIS